MNKNLGKSDRVIRLVLAGIMAGLYFTGTFTGTIDMVLLVLSIVFAVTSFISFCPIYAILGLKTCPVDLKGKTNF